MQVIKRTNEPVDFSKDKIINAITRAMDETELGVNIELAVEIADNIEDDINDLDIMPTVETIQNMVEEYLMDSRKDVAKQYILYREERNRLRNNPQWEMTELQKAIWENKYRYKNESFDGFLNRVSNGNEHIKKLMIHKKLLPAGRILAGRGTHKDGKKITLSNCFVLPSPEDNIESIFDTAKYMARTYSYGGGVGIDISKLRPKKSKVNNAAKTTSGAISFMDLYSLTTELIGQSGRRGALMITLDCSHPDLLDFINCKTDLNKVTRANISIKVSDDFMNAVLDNADWKLHFTIEETGEVIEKIVKAQEIYHIFCKMDWNYAEPSLVYWSRINNWNLLSEDDEFEYVGLNPCAEEPLPEFGSCNLISLNLAEFIINPFTDNARFDYDRFNEAVKHTVVYMNDLLDEAIENNLYPLEKQKQSVIDWRQIGIGIMGIADMLIKMNIKYGNKESLELCDKIGFEMINSALQQSALLSKEIGTYEKYKEDAVLKSEFLKYNAYPETIQMIKEYGLRNSQVLTIAPTGSLSTMLGISGGIEPIYQISYTRKTESLHDEDTYYKVFTPIAKEYMDKFDIKTEEELPDIFITANDLNYYDRVDMQSVWQNHIDASISSTVNLPFATSVKQVEDLYIYAWEKGLKGITIFRDGCKRSGVLTTDKTEEHEKIEGAKCLECGSQSLIRTNSCVLCLECGHSPCS
jgi:ribonucleoside-diphosphate reductase alpha chain